MFHKEQLEEIEKKLVILSKQVWVLDRILYRVINHLALSATLRITGDSTMPATIAVGGKGAKAVFTEFDGANGTGDVVAPIQTPVFSSSAASVATVDASGNVTAVAVGTATITATDPGNSLTASDTVTVVPGTAVSATLVVTAN
jgi:Bacterial Ig-like domain (group 2)